MRSHPQNRGFITGWLTALVLAGVELDAVAAPGDSRFLGGSFDGAAWEYAIQTDPGPLNVRFSGGPFDGVAWEYAIQTDAHTLNPRFSGGPLDGCDFQSFLQPGSTVPSIRFSGGAWDGADNAVATGLTNPLDRDTDGDSLPDWWELPYFGGVTNAPTLADVDHDGCSELNEYTADTDPTNPLSFLHITRLSNAPSATVFFQPASSNRVYTLEKVTNLVIVAWTNLADQTPVRGPGGPFMLNDTGGSSRVFYRIRVAFP